MRIASGFNFGGSAPPNIVTRGLVVWLDAGNLNSYSGTGVTWDDMRGNNNSVTLVNGPTYLTDNGGIIDFDGADDTGTVNGSDANTPYASAECWVKLDNPNNAVNEQIIARSNTSRGTFNILKTSVSPQTWTFNLTVSGGTLYILGSGIGATTDWTHLVATYDGTTQIIYVNAVEAATNSITETINTGGTYLASIGSNTNGAARMNGKLAIVRLYDRALTPSEILQNYNAQRGRFGV